MNRPIKVRNWRNELFLPQLMIFLKNLMQQKIKRLEVIYINTQFKINSIILKNY
jgi:hypothetical protein